MDAEADVDAFSLARVVGAAADNAHDTTDERLLRAMARAADTLVTLHARVALWVLLTSWADLTRAERDAVARSLASTPRDTLALVKLLGASAAGAGVNAWGALSGAVTHAMSLFPDVASSFASLVSVELATASLREYAFVPWDEDVGVHVVHVVWSAMGEDPPCTSVFSDEFAVRHPDVGLASHVTRALLGLSSSTWGARLVRDWANAMRAPGCKLKIVAAETLVGMALAPSGDPGEAEDEVVAALRAALPRDRVERLAASLVSRGGSSGSSAVHSRFTLAMVELAAALCSLGM